MKANMRTNRTRVHFMYRVCFDIPYLATGSIRHRSILSWMILVSSQGMKNFFGNDLICDSLAFDKYQDFYPYKLMITRRRTRQPTLLKIIQVGGGGVILSFVRCRQHRHTLHSETCPPYCHTAPSPSKCGLSSP